MVGPSPKQGSWSLQTGHHLQPNGKAQDNLAQQKRALAATSLTLGSWRRLYFLLIVQLTLTWEC